MRSDGLTRGRIGAEKEVDKRKAFRVKRHPIDRLRSDVAKDERAANSIDDENVTAQARGIAAGDKRDSEKGEDGALRSFRHKAWRLRLIDETLW
jgi:hypothetical protein